MKRQYIALKTHAANASAVVLAVGFVLAKHSPDNPITIYDFAPVIIAIGQYLISLKAMNANPPNQVTAPQINLIHDLAQERAVTKGKLCEMTNQIELCDLTRRQATELIQSLKRLPRKRVTQVVEADNSKARENFSQN